MPGLDAAGSLLRVCQALDEADAPYMVVGAFAVMAHGSPRTSADIDIVLHLPFKDRDELRPLAEDLGVDRVEERVDPQWGRRLVTTLPSGLELELFFTYGHPLYEREFERRVFRTLRGQGIPFMSPEDLILRKLVNTRLRTKHDLEDAISVVKVQGENLEVPYLREHCGVQRVCGLLEDVLREAGHPEAGS